MNQDNFKYLKEQVKYAGFGDALEAQLKENLEAQQPIFQLKHEHEFGKDKVDALLNFRKSNSADKYFFNSYEVKVKPDKGEETTSQTFYMGKANNYTLKEAYNLLSGRAVYKQFEKLDKVGEAENVRYVPNGEKYNAWVQLDFKNTDKNGNYELKPYHDNYGFNLSEALDKLPIKGLDKDQDKQELMRSLEKGNRQFVSFQVDGNVENRYLQANPQYKMVTVFDAQLKRIRLDNKEGKGQDENSNSNKNSQKAGESQKVEPEKKSKRSKQKQSL
ncbi:MAG: hypothetical protein ACTHJ0_15955 [Flavipsychrobacter sp.]